MDLSNQQKQHKDYIFKTGKNIPTYNANRLGYSLVL